MKQEGYRVFQGRGGRGENGKLVWSCLSLSTLSWKASTKAKAEGASLGLPNSLLLGGDSAGGLQARRGASGPERYEQHLRSPAEGRGSVNFPCTCTHLHAHTHQLTCRDTDRPMESTDAFTQM